ncbi:hypothetical protein WJX84_002596 [Apatococcus fuscideae]|uniref:Rhodanese domain-containing protein n=1 Tax=Apatococcus fuscideae TaxID=2026836 RepID=A0AAW1T126_9CHLO
MSTVAALTFGGSAIRPAQRETAASLACSVLNSTQLRQIPHSPRSTLLQAQSRGETSAGGEKFIYAGDVLEEARRMSSNFIFEDSDDMEVWEHDERLAATSSSSAVGSEVKGALDPQQLTDVLTAYSAEQGFREVGTETLRDSLGQRETTGLILLDVRSKEEFEGGHVPSALNIPLDKLATSAKDGWLGDCKTRPIAVICKSGSRSAQAAVKLTKVLGFEDVVNVSGGTEGWMTSGSPFPRRLWLGGFIVLLLLTAWASHRQVQVTTNDAPTWVKGRRNLQQQEDPLVALMFLTRGPMPLEPVWREFMEASAMIEPIDSSAIQARKPHVTKLAQAYTRDQAAEQFQQQQQQQQQRSEDQEAMESLARQQVASEDNSKRLPVADDGRRLQKKIPWSGPWSFFAGTRKPPQPKQPSKQGSSAEWTWSARAQRDIIAMQHLFSVYVHCPPDFFYAPGNLFFGYEIPGRVPVTWGQWSVVEGERILLRTALKNTANQRFILLSETCLPLGPPHMLYLQFLSERLARINACKQDTVEDAYRRGLDRWQPAMNTARLQRRHWRKSAQWFSLSRRHAAAVAADFHAAPLFEEHCYSYLPGRDLPVPAKVQVLLEQNITVQRRTCVADEHYVPTLLAMHGLDSETDCMGMMTHTSWTWPAWSPKTYAHWQITPSFLDPLRKMWFKEEACDWGAAQRSASTNFRLHGSRAALSSLPHWRPLRSTRSTMQVQPYVPLGPGCSLIARKFDLSSLDAAMRLGADCENGFGWSTFCYLP